MRDSETVEWRADEWERLSVDPMADWMGALMAVLWA